MKSNRSILRKSALMLALSVSAVLFLPKVLFAKGAVVGYVWGQTNVTPEQLDRLTHVVVSDLYMDGNCKKNHVWGEKIFENVYKYQKVFLSLQRNILSKSNRS